MVNFCAVRDCGNRANREMHHSFFRIPKVRNVDNRTKRELKEKQQRQWLVNIGRADIKVDKIEHYRVCSAHFITGKPAVYNDEGNPDWAPTLKMNRDKNVSDAKSEETAQRRQQRYLRASRRESMRVEISAAQGLLALHEEPPLVEADVRVDLTVQVETQTLNKTTKEVSVQTDIHAGDIAVLEAQADSNNKEILKAKEEADKLKFTEQSFQNDDKKTKFYTGLPTFAILMLIFNYVKDKLTSRMSVTPFQQLLIVLMKLRLAVPNEDLAYRFLVSKSTISRVFNTGIDSMYGISKLVTWPAREVLWKTMPLQFRRTFGKHVAVIIDCFEVFCNRPTSLEARAQTFSNYKHHNTVKFLIGITPRGVISFLSAAWGGRGTDKTITLASDFFNHLLPGDIILADRGFDIKDDAGFYGCQAEIPAFTRGKAQLSALDVEKTREIAHLRKIIHLNVIKIEI